MLTCTPAPALLQYPPQQLLTRLAQHPHGHVFQRMSQELEQATAAKFPVVWSFMVRCCSVHVQNVDIRQRICLSKHWLPMRCRRYPFPLSC